MPTVGPMTVYERVCQLQRRWKCLTTSDTASLAYANRRFISWDTVFVMEGAPLATPILRAAARSTAGEGFL